MKVPLLRNDHGYSFIEFEAGSHGHRKTRIWIHREIAYDLEELEFPVSGWVHKTEKGSLVLRPEPKGTVYYIRVPSGYRGSARIDLLDCKPVAEGSEFHSGQGALGETAWAIAQSNSRPIVVHAHITGRRIDKNDIIFRLTPDGNREEIIEDSEICDLMEN